MVFCLPYNRIIQQLAEFLNLLKVNAPVMRFTTVFLEVLLIQLIRFDCFFLFYEILYI